MTRALALGVLLAGCLPVPAPQGAPSPPDTHPRARARHAAPSPLPVALSLDRIVTGGRYPTLAAAIAAARLDPILAGAGPLTMFAPDEAAWARLAPDVRAALFRPENRGSLAMLLRFHLVAGRIDDGALRLLAANGPMRLPTLAGESLTVSISDGVVLLTDASGHRAYIVGTDGPAANGSIHELNGLLVPEVLGPQG